MYYLDANTTIVDKGTAVDVVVSKGAGMVEVPDMLGRNWEEVKEELEELCIEYEAEEEKSTEYPGNVTYQSLEAGSEVEQGTVVKVTVSKGNDYDESVNKEMTSLIGHGLEEAKELAVELGVYLKVTEYRYDDAIPKDEIMGQSIGEGETVKGGSVVEIVVSKGIEQFEVPELVGKPEEEAVKLLEEKNFTVKRVIVVNEEEEEGRVLEQDKEAGKYLDKYSEITIGVCIHGIPVVDLKGKTLEEAQKEFEGYDVTLKAEYKYGGNDTIAGQSVATGEIVQPGSEITVEIRLDEERFTRELVALLNQRRIANGCRELELSETWSDVAYRFMAEPNAYSNGNIGGLVQYSRIETPRIQGCKTAEELVGLIDSIAQPQLVRLVSLKDIWVIGIAYMDDYVQILGVAY